MKMPKFVCEWAKDADIDPDDIWSELAYSDFKDDPDWELVSEELYSEEKYGNINERILHHLGTGRYVRLWTDSLPYGIESYGAEEANEHTIEEVFPLRVMTTVYLTKQELKERKDTDGA